MGSWTWVVGHGRLDMGSWDAGNRDAGIGGSGWCAADIPARYVRLPAPRQPRQARDVPIPGAGVDAPGAAATPRHPPQCQNAQRSCWRQRPLPRGIAFGISLTDSPSRHRPRANRSSTNPGFGRRMNRQDAKALMARTRPLIPPEPCFSWRLGGSPSGRAANRR